ncbi:MAG: hypothetical protein Q8J92_11455 [Parvibaculum sp.]|nr:hypothetical protein [Parvibaculum sp.]
MSDRAIPRKGRDADMRDRRRVPGTRALLDLRVMGFPCATQGASVGETCGNAGARVCQPVVKGEYSFGNNRNIREKYFQTTSLLLSEISKSIEESYSYKYRYRWIFFVPPAAMQGCA